MSWLASLVLYFMHAVYASTTVVTSWRNRRFAREPLPLVAERRKLPHHVAILLASIPDHVTDVFEQETLQNIEQAVDWCRKAGIQRLTLYDRQGVLSRLSFDLRARILQAGPDAAATTSESELEYPLTPPLSASPSSSRSLSPKQEVVPKLHVTTLKLDDFSSKRRHSVRGVVKRRTSRKDSESTASPFVVDVVSRESGKVAMAEVASALARNHDRSSSHANPAEDFKLSIRELKSLMESENGFPSPDLMLVHHTTLYKQPKAVLELFGFSPWHISLTEYYYSLYPSSWWTYLSTRKHTDTYIPLQETDLRRALDQFAGAEMRLGK
ncbi:hypothetical protein BC629DRAFT_1468908 [Irpex lacteus]|nr:hypothetical protein BC629DRAFT_1468908 [Irpex lacteus]